ncbi:hypothetical protein [Schleiferilactobacillus harbinensis]|uniref:Uncharacterized protein n=2 Tax=Schleiferilactobacillus harbinensis TaxID=304207 RepID=A0A5P8M675_9LACO|nr:hypothetical protein [Schleiferilactobacillus harbinensis]QFR23784.1 hypothetical protein D1010_10420 [Schleiferilactobacillus harbinensis]
MMQFKSVFQKLSFAAIFAVAFALVILGLNSPRNWGIYIVLIIFLLGVLARFLNHWDSKRQNTDK